MKKLLITLILTGALFQLEAQTLTPTVLSSGGADLKVPNSAHSFTLGQLAIDTYSATGAVLTQGFHQPVVVSSDCLADFNGDEMVTTADLLILLSDYGCLSSCTADVNGDDMVTTADLLILLSVFGTSCS